MRHRVLVVEDHQWWRRSIAAELEQTSRWAVVGAAADGREAVEKARDLKPDVILMDIGLPELDGIQAARRMLAQDPSSRILFLTEQHSLDMAEVALGIGARGYIVKSDVGRDLLPAMEAVVEGARFISAKMAGRGFETTSDGRVAREIRYHEALFYSDESSLLDDYATFLEAALDAGNGLMLLLTPSRRDQLHQRLQARGIDLESIITKRRCVWMDVSVILSSVMVNGRVDESRFWNGTSALIMEAARGSTLTPPRVSGVGECAPALLKDGLIDAAIQLERLCDDVARTFHVEILCAYSRHGLRCDGESKVFQDLCAAHSAVRVR